MTPMTMRSRATTPKGRESSRRTLPSVPHNLGGRLLVGFVCVWTVLGWSACFSNPTPHPANDATLGQDTSRGDGDPNIAAPTDQAGCDAVGGFWTGEDCQTEAAPDSDASAIVPDASDSVDDAGPEDGDAEDPDGSNSDADNGEYEDDGAEGAGGQTPR